MPMNWNHADLCQRLGTTLDQAEAETRLEQAVYGLDSLDELKLQTLLAAGLATHYDVSREVHYPSTAGRKLTSRQRCDLVLAPPGHPLKRDATPASLFDPVEPTPPEKALWLEVKVAYQFKEGGRRHGGYTQQWRGRVVDDLRKMEAEPLIRSAGLVLVVFTESLELFAKDCELFEDVLALKEVLAGFRKTHNTPIWDRIGHRFCSVAVWPTVQR